MIATVAAAALIALQMLICSPTTTSNAATNPTNIVVTDQSIIN